MYAFQTSDPDLQRDGSFCRHLSHQKKYKVGLKYATADPEIPKTTPVGNPLIYSIKAEKKEMLTQIQATRD